MDNLSFVTDYYNEKAINYGINERRLKNSLFLINNVRKSKVLDIGCATGYVGQIVKGQNYYIIGIDISERVIRKAKKVIILNTSSADGYS